MQHLREEGVRDDGERMVSLLTGICHLLQSELDLDPAKPDASVDDGECWQLEVWMAGSEATGKEVSAGEEASVLAGMMKARYSGLELPM